MIDRSIFSKCLFIFSILLLTACDTGPGLEQKLATAHSLVPTDPVIAEIYQRSCRNCHTVEATGAPLVGDKLAWAELISEVGKPALLQNVINGKGGMPPFGLCMECSMDDFSALIDFMAQQ